jgi:site-specific DNA-methyltransferase (adenine-specific)
MNLVNEMLNKLPVEVWKNKDFKWLDPAVGMGNFPIAVYLRLMESLTDIIEDKAERKKHILENMLYMCELNKKNVFVCKQIFDINNEYKLNIYEGDSLKLDYKKEFGVDKFDIVLGNPPYNEELTKVGAKPLYNKFIEFYVEKCKLLMFITPSRWFAGGKGLDKFRTMMLNRNDIVFIKHFDDACKIFGNKVSIEGGVNYFLINTSYNGLCNYNGSNLKLNTYDIILDNKYYNVVNKLLNYDKITKYYISQDHYKIQTNDKRLIDEYREGWMKCYVSQQKGFIKYIDKRDISKDISAYKVITARANGKYKCFGNIFIGYPNEVHTKSYISFNVNNEHEAKSLISRFLFFDLL